MTLKSLLEKSDFFVGQGEIGNAIDLGPRIIREYYKKLEGRDLDIGTHGSFSAKIHQRMIDFHVKGVEKGTLLADKLAAKQYVANIIGNEFIPEVLWEGSQLSENIYDELPKTGILKCNEGCGKNIILTSAQDLAHLKKETDRWLNDAYYWLKREYQYYNIQRRLYVEELIDDGHPDGPIDYIFFCFDGKAKLIQTGSRSHTIHSFFTTNWEQLQLTYREKFIAPSLPKPDNLNKMIEIAEALSKDIDFVRIDLYSAKKNIYFGEMTLTPCAGNIKFVPEVWNMKLGKLWNYHYDL